MSREADHQGFLSKDDLELNLQNAEVNLAKIEAIRASGGMTYSKHDEITTVPDFSLALELDPDGNATGPAGSQRLFGGEAMIENQRKRVAVFRKAAAAAPQAAAPNPAATPQAATPNPTAPANTAAPAAQGDAAQSQPGAGSGSDPTDTAGDGND